MTVPTNALLIRGEGVRVAVVDPRKQVRLRPVKIGRNYGPTVEVLDGLSTSDEVVLNPPDSLSEGDQVAVTPQAAQKSAAAERPEATTKR